MLASRGQAPASAGWMCLYRRVRGHRLVSLALLALAIGCGATASRPPKVAAVTTTLIDRAHTAERAREYLRARELYERAITTAPDRESRRVATQQLAAALIFWGQYRDAATTLERLTELSPRDPRPWHNLGLVRYRLGDVAGAEHALGRAISLAPADPRPRVALAALYANQHRNPAAIREYRALLALPHLPDRLRDAAQRAILLLAEPPPP